MSLLIQRKQPTVLFANDNTQPFKCELEFWKTFHFCHEFDSFSMVAGFYDEIGIDIIMI